ncbi:MAG: adenosylmethionine--8-amino-7-oxononanoate transaminase, partial [Clostridia bacterium]|nr:adenosylmethionine--8-amino-7-oxononanoate transaminase [Deltaproteobacteria bacterium]
EQLAEHLVRTTPSGLSKVFFSDNGSTAVEVALKMALQARAQQGHPEKTRFVTFAAAYHGDTVGAMSVSGQGPFNAAYRSTLFDVIQATQPMVSTASAEAFVSDVARLMSEHHQTLAGLIIEPLIQGAGGMRMWPAEAVARIARMARAHDVYVIFDEVMTGFGRTGHLFALDAVGVTPDIMCVAKGLTAGTLPLAATVATQDIFDAFWSDDRSKMLFHGHSFTANPIACAAANASFDLFRRNETREQLAIIARVQRDEVMRTAQCTPVLDPRVCGTVAAFDLPLAESGYIAAGGTAVARVALERGVVLRPLGNTVYLMPPYCATEADLRQVWEVIRWAIQCSGALDF